MMDVIGEDADHTSILGNIYIGKISRIVKNINAAFVDIGIGTQCYLSLEDIKGFRYINSKTSDIPKAGDELLVEVTREAQKGKRPTLSPYLQFKSEHLILIAGQNQISASSKIGKKRKTELKELLNAELQNGFGVLIRTAAKDVDDNVLLEEFHQLQQESSDLLSSWAHRTCFSLLRTSKPSYVDHLLHTASVPYDEIVTDSPQIYRDLKEAFSLSNQQTSIEKLRLYEDTQLPLLKLYSVEAQLTKALSQRIWLKSGAYLIIQPTEALTVIDVNSGKKELGKSKSGNILQINIEAAHEIARQLRIRNLSGIIIVDFIDMTSEEHKEAVLSAMKAAAAADTVPVKVLGLTKLGLMEITRKKIRKPLVEILN